MMKYQKDMFLEEFQTIRYGLQMAKEIEKFLQTIRYQMVGKLECCINWK